VNRATANFSVIAIAGGPGDTQVRGDLSMLPGALLSTSAEQVPGVWVSPDHQCILWCNQLVVAVARALGDALTPTHNPPALPPRVQREGVVRRHLAPTLWGTILGRYRHTALTL
jgi:hypothetical protein